MYNIRVLVCGGRHYQNEFNVFSVLNILHLKHRIVAVIDGVAQGADTFGSNWANVSQIENIRFPADWDNHGKRAGPIRNAKMLAIGNPDIVIAFPGGAGTENMIKQATDILVPVIRIEKDYAS